jgi:hypothetical protein
VLAFAQAEAARARGDQRVGSGERDSVAGAPPGQTFRYAAAAVTLGAAAAGLTLSTLSVVSYVNSADSSQVERASENARRRTLNLASVACYAVAAVAGTAWAWSAVSSRSVSVNVAGPGDFRVEVTQGGHF